MRSQDLVDKLMELEIEAREGGLDNEEIASAYELRKMALDEEDDASEGEGEEE